MLRKLKNTKCLCNIAAIVLGFLTGALLINEDSKPEIGMLMLAIVIVVSVVDNRISKRIRQIEFEEHQKLPVNTTRATVWKRRVGYRYWPIGKGRVRSSSPMYYVTYETERRGAMEFYVPRDMYFSAHEGMSGYLKYKGNEFISFN